MRDARMPPLNDEERRVLCRKGTERPFSGRYWNFSEPGVYVCRACGAPLYTSEDKFDSDCGCPVLTRKFPAASRVPRTRTACARKFSAPPAERIWGMCLKANG